MKLCPFCHQDDVWYARLKSSPNLRFKICFECDSVWSENQTVSDREGSTFEKYMRGLDRVPDWKDIEKLQMVE